MLIAASPATSQFNLPPERADAAPGANANVHVIPDCTVGLVSTLELPATEAGVLTYVGVKPGSQIQTEEIIARIDPDDAELTVERLEHECEAADKQANDDIDIKYSQLSKEVERTDYEEALAVNHEVPNAITANELRKERLEYDRARLGEQKAHKDRDLAEITARAKLVELRQAKLALDRREIEAPFDGEVLKVNREQGEWVKPGDVIAELADLETLQVDGKVFFDEYLPNELDKCRVTIEVPIGRQKIEATGWVTYIDPIAEIIGGKARYYLRAEITNRRVGGRWMISPNMKATMKIQLGTGDDAQVGDRTRETRVAK